MAKANSTRSTRTTRASKGATINADGSIRSTCADLDKIHAMVVAARHTVRSIDTCDADHAHTLLMEVDNRIFALKSLHAQEGGAA